MVYPITGLSSVSFFALMGIAISNVILFDRLVQFLGDQEAEAKLLRAPTSLHNHFFHPSDAVMSDDVYRRGLRSNQRDSLLQCEAYGGPDLPIAKEMVYWQQSNTDASFTSHFSDPTVDQYLTMEPQQGEFEDVRSIYESAAVLAALTGRTLVLPPRAALWDLENEKSAFKNNIGLQDIFHMPEQLSVISFDEFLERQVQTGSILRHPETGTPRFPPGNATEWDGRTDLHDDWEVSPGATLWNWMRSVTTSVDWEVDECLVGLPTEDDPQMDEFGSAMLQILKEEDEDLSKAERIKKRIDQFRGNPTAVDAPLVDRLREMVAHRRKICTYDVHHQHAPVLHLKGQQQHRGRLMSHFYALFLSADWRQDVAMKRLVRDEIRYSDEIQCAAGRIVQILREISSWHGGDGTFDSMHLQRGHFLRGPFLKWAPPAQEIADGQYVEPKRTLFVLSNEHNGKWYDPLREKYHLYFVEDFEPIMDGINKNLYPMVDQLVAAKAERFVGTYTSQKSGYINRLRGYHAAKQRSPGYLEGTLETSEYIGYRDAMYDYRSIEKAFWKQDWPVSWRDIDHPLPMDGASRQSL